MRHVVASKKIGIKRKSFVGQAVLLLLGLELMFLASFTGLSLPTGTGGNLVNALRQSIKNGVEALPPNLQERLLERCPNLTAPVKPVRYSIYTPELPVAVFLGYVLGLPISPLAPTFFLLGGLIGPSFGIYPLAGGGGLDYYKQPGFGYLIGLIFAAWAAGKITHEKRTSLSQITAVILATLAGHVVGMVYLLGSCLLFTFFDGAKAGPLWLTWVFEEARNMTWYPLPYDLFFAFILIGVGFPFKYLAQLLTAPHLALKSKTDIIAQQQIEQILG